MINWIGFSSIIIPFQVRKRAGSHSKYTVLKMLKLGFHGITSFSTVPLYLSGIFSCLLFIAAFGYGVYVLYIRFFTDTVVSGWTSVILITLVIGGFLSLFIGLIGMYVAAIYDEVKHRPDFITKNIIEVAPKKL
jgi:dolichol-phosphate mannosyltransferase